MTLIADLVARAKDPSAPFLVDSGAELSLRDVANNPVNIDAVQPGDVVALIGDFDAISIATLLALIDKKAIIMPLTGASVSQHEYFFTAGHASHVIKNGKMERLRQPSSGHLLLENLRQREHAGLILFSSGTTGLPKAILHDFSHFLARYETPRPAWRALNFLLFDHIGGLNTLFHTLYNNGLVVRPSGHDADSVTHDIRNYNIELLPATPTFLRLWVLGGLPEPAAVPSLRLITYGTERMDQNTLDLLAAAFPQVDIRQTYGMSELGILRVRTKKRDELWIQVGGEGIETAVAEGELLLRSQNRMEGYLNAPQPFDSDGWYSTGDIVECDGEWLKIMGRRDGLINVGGLKVLPAEVEHAALEFPGICLARATGKPNPLTGMHVELLCQLQTGAKVEKNDLRLHLKAVLPPHAIPRRITFGNAQIGHRFKQL